MVSHAQLFDDHKSTRAPAGRRGLLAAAEEDAELKQQRAKIDELQRQLQERPQVQVAAEKNENMSQRKQTKPRGFNFICWNCGKRAHYARDCYCDHVGNGLTYRPERSDRHRLPGPRGSSPRWD